MLAERVCELEAQPGDPQARALLVDRDQAADCVKDMLATAKWYGFEQPRHVRYDPMAGLEAIQA